LRYIEEITRRTLAFASGGRSPLSKGGMVSKLKAAQAASRAGCAAVIANGRVTGILGRIMQGEDVGTIVPAS
jgi:glutamate 5-kinase